MDVHLRRTAVIGCLVLIQLILSTTKGDIPKPTFPEAFETEVLGINKGALTEFDAQIYYDRKNNRAAMVFTQDGVSTRSIYNFDDKVLISIHGVKCTVSDISENPEESFFLFEYDDNNNMKLVKAEQLFHFTNSNYSRKDYCLIPSDVYEATVDLLMYGRKNCEISHYFSTQEEEVPDCEGHNCKPTLVGITLNCPKTNEQDELNLIFNFYRFRSGIKNENIFRTPEGIFCNTTSRERFPALPEYFSFSYRTLKDLQGGRNSAGVYSTHNKVWYDSKLSLLRIDEFDANGLLETSRILDSYGGTTYTTTARIMSCQPGPIADILTYGEMTNLPNILFKKKPTYDDAVYVGTRAVNGLTYYVWSLSFTDDETDALTVQEFYFTKILLNDDGYSELQLTHINVYISERNDDTFELERSVVAYTSISNFRTKPKEWEAFDISSCFSNSQKKGFRLKVEGPAIIKGSFMYEDLLRRLYIKLISITRVSVIRINQLKGTFDGVHIKEFSGWILDKPKTSSKTNNTEPDMQTAYTMIEKAAAEGKLSLEIKDKDIKYVVTAMEEVEPPSITDGCKGDKSKGCYTGVSLASAGLTLFALGIFLGTTSYYVFLKKRKPLSDDKVQLSSLAEDKI